MKSLEIIDNAIEELTSEEGFVVDTDLKAEWCVKKLAEEKQEMERIVKLCESMANEYKRAMQEVQERYQDKVRYFKGILAEYFDTVQTKATKTQATYKLPSATLKRKLGGLEYIRDDEKLVSWLKENGKNELIKVKEEAMWSELKKELIFKDGKAITADGEVVEAIKVKQMPDKFEIDFN